MQFLFSKEQFISGHKAIEVFLAKSLVRYDKDLRVEVRMHGVSAGKILGRFI